MQEKLRKEDLLIGTRQVMRYCEEKKLTKVYIAIDADSFLKDKIISTCKANEIPFQLEYTKKEMGDMANIQVDAAVIGIL